MGVTTLPWGVIQPFSGVTSFQILGYYWMLNNGVYIQMSGNFPPLFFEWVYAHFSVCIVVEKCHGTHLI